VFGKKPQPLSSVPRGRATSSRSFGTHSIIARTPIERCKLILETTFAIKDEFSKNDAIEWAVQELKRRGLKRLFKPIASTAYGRLVQAFYEHLRYNCNRPDVLVSSIDGGTTLPCSPSRTSSLTCVRGNMQISTGMQPAKRRFRGIFGSLTCRAI
jgi:hypothetical protein